MKKLLVLSLAAFSFSALAHEKLETTKYLSSCGGKVELWSSDAMGVESYYLKFMGVTQCSKVDIGLRTEDFAQNIVSKVKLTTSESYNWIMGKSTDLKLTVHSNSRAHQDIVYVRPANYFYSSVSTPISSVDTYKLPECSGTLSINSKTGTYGGQSVEVKFFSKYCDKVRLDGKDYNLGGDFGNYSETFTLNQSEIARGKTSGLKFKVFSYGFFSQYDSVDNLIIKLR